MRARPIAVPLPTYALAAMTALACSSQTLPPPRVEPAAAVPASASASGSPPAVVTRPALAPASTACAALASAKPEAPKPADWTVLSRPLPAPSASAKGLPYADLEAGSFTLSADGHFGAAWTTGERRLRVFDLVAGAELPWTSSLTGVNQVELAESRALVSLVTKDGYDVVLVDLATGRVERRMSVAESPALAIDRTGAVYAFGGAVSTINVVSAADDRVLRKAPMPHGHAYLSSDGTALVTTSGGAGTPCFVDVRRLDRAGDRHVRIGDSCPNELAVGRHGERLAWVDVDRKKPGLPWHVYVLEKTGAPRRGPSVAEAGWLRIAFDATEERVVLSQSVTLAQGRLTDTTLALRPLVDARRVAFGADGSFVEASTDGFFRHAASSSLAILGRPLPSHGTPLDDGTFAIIGARSLRWYTPSGELLGGVLAPTHFRQPFAKDDELGVLTDHADLTLARTPTGIALKSLVPMRYGCSFDHGCTRLAPGLVANLNESNAHLGDHPTVGLAGPFLIDKEPARLESPLVGGSSGVATDGTFVQVAKGELVARNVCADEPWRRFLRPGADPYAMQVCPGFVIIETASRDRFDVVSTANGKLLTTLVPQTKGEFPACGAVRRELEGTSGDGAKPAVAP